jgi:hypothetical protein
MGRNWTRKSIEEIFWHMFKKYGKGGSCPTYVDQISYIMPTAKAVGTASGRNTYRFLPSLLQLVSLRTNWVVEMSGGYTKEVWRENSGTGNLVFMVPIPETSSNNLLHYAGQMKWMPLRGVTGWGLPYVYYITGSDSNKIYKIKKSTQTYPYNIGIEMGYTMIDNNFFYHNISQSTTTTAKLQAIQDKIDSLGVHGGHLLCCDYQFSDADMLSYSSGFLINYFGTKTVVEDLDLDT